MTTRPIRHPALPIDQAIDRRALLLWPRLDRRALARCHHDVTRIVRLVGRRTSLPSETIRILLAAPTVTADETERWFG